MSDNRITIRLKDELRAKIRHLAETQDKNPSEVIREAIIRHLAVVSGNNKSSAATLPR
jgi:predicted transcriptional regulator